MTTSALVVHLRTLKNRGALVETYERELSEAGVYHRFHRGELVPTQAAKEILNRTLGEFWHSIRIFGYDPEDDRLMAPVSAAKDRAVTLSDRAIRDYGPEERTALQEQRRADVSLAFYEKQAHELGEFFFLVHFDDDSALSREAMFECYTTGGSRRLYVVDWNHAEEWYRCSGVALVRRWYSEHRIMTPPPSNFFSVPAQGPEAPQVLFISVRDRTGQTRGLAALRFYADSFTKYDLATVDAELGPVLNLIAPFLPSFNERISLARAAARRAVVVERLAAVLNHDMKNYFPGVTATLSERNLATLRTVLANSTVPASVSKTATQCLNDLEVLKDLSDVQASRVRQIRAVSKLLISPRISPSNRQSERRQLNYVVRAAVGEYGRLIALQHADPNVKYIYLNLLGTYVLVEAVPAEVHIEFSHCFAVTIVLGQLLDNGIMAVTLKRLPENPLHVRFQKTEEGFHVLEVENRIFSPVSEDALRRFIDGDIDETMVGDGTGCGLAACDFILKAAFGPKAKLDPSAASEFVRMRVVIPPCEESP